MVNASLALGGFSVGKSQNKPILSMPVSNQLGFTGDALRLHICHVPPHAIAMLCALNHDITWIPKTLLQQGGKNK